MCVAVDHHQQPIRLDSGASVWEQPLVNAQNHMWQDDCKYTQLLSLNFGSLPTLTGKLSTYNINNTVTGLYSLKNLLSKNIMQGRRFVVEILALLYALPGSSPILPAFL